MEMGISRDAIKQLIEVAHLCFQRNLTVATSGNLSLRSGDEMYLSTASACLGTLSENDIVLLPISSRGLQVFVGDRVPSSEYAFHQYVYQHSSFGAILHLHPPYCIALSAHTDEFVPATVERIYFPRSISVIQQTTAQISNYEAVVEALKQMNAVILQNHGIVTASDDLWKAFYLADMLEHLAQVAFQQQLWAKHR